MSCCGQHRANAVLEADAPDAIQPDDPCLLCAEKHFEYARRLCQEYGYTDANRGDAIGELVACGEHLAGTGHANLANAVRAIRHKLQLRRDGEVVWRHAAAAIRATAAAEAKRIQENPT